MCQTTFDAYQSNLTTSLFKSGFRNSLNVWSTCAIEKEWSVVFLSDSTVTMELFTTEEASKRELEDSFISNPGYNQL